MSLAMHKAHNHRRKFLYDTLDEQFGDEDIQWGCIEQLDVVATSYGSMLTAGRDQTFSYWGGDSSRPTA